MARRKPQKKQKDRVITTVYLPVASYGICINEQCPKHKSKTEVILGDGYCQKCFDKLCGPGFEKNGGKKGKKQKKKKTVEPTSCPECGEIRYDEEGNLDSRIQAGMKCTICAY